MSKARRTEALQILHARGEFPNIAAELGINRQAPYLWRTVPAERVLDVEKITGMKRHQLRPDLYPPPRKRKHKNGQR